MFQQEKTTTMDLTKHLESTLKTCVGTRLKNLATKVELLKEIRYLKAKLCVFFTVTVIEPRVLCILGRFFTIEQKCQLQKIFYMWIHVCLFAYMCMGTCVEARDNFEHHSSGVFYLGF